MPFVRYGTEVENVSHMREGFRTNVSSDSNMVDLSRCYLPHPFSSLCLVKVMEMSACELE